MDVYISLSPEKNILLGKIPVAGVDSVSLQMTEESELSGFFRILEKPDIRVLPAAYHRLCSSLEVNGMSALQVVPKRKLSNHLDSELRRLQDALCAIEDQEYLVCLLYTSDAADDLL